MAYSFVSTANSGAGIFGNTITFAIDVGSGTNRGLRVSPGWFRASGVVTLSSVTFNGDTVTPVTGAAITANDGVGISGTDIAVRAAPDAGNHDVVVTLTGNADALGAGADAGDGLDQTPNVTAGTPTSSTNDQTPSVTITANAGDILFGTVAGIPSPNPYTTSETERWTQRTAGAVGYAGNSLVATGGADTLDWAGGAAATGYVASVIAWAIAASGGSNIKSIDGLAIASVKTVNGLAIASMKSRNGLT